MANVNECRHPVMSRVGRDGAAETERLKLGGRYHVTNASLRGAQILRILSLHSQDTGREYSRVLVLVLRTLTEARNRCRAPLTFRMQASDQFSGVEGTPSESTTHTTVWYSVFHSYSQTRQTIDAAK